MFKKGKNLVNKNNYFFAKDLTQIFKKAYSIGTFKTLSNIKISMILGHKCLTGS